MTDVGSASVEVKGDVRDFARQTERELNAALSRVNVNPVPIEVDTDAARRSGEQAGAALGDGITRGADGRLRDSRGKFVKMGEDSGRGIGDGIGRGTEDSLGKNRGRFSSFLRTAFTPDPNMFAALRAPFAAALSTPIVGAMVLVAGVAAASFVGALITALATAGLGAVFLGIGAAALFGAKKSRDQAEKDLAKAEERVRKAEQRAQSGTAASKRSLADAMAQLAKAKGAVEDNAAFVKLDDSLKKLGQTLKNVGKSAAAPLMGPFTAALNLLSDKALELTPLLHDIFEGLAPAIGPLTEGIAGFVTEFLKVINEDPATIIGIRDALIALGANLPKIGAAMGQFFAILASNEDNVENIGILFDLLSSLIVNTGRALDGMTGDLKEMRDGWNATMEVVSAVTDWIMGTAVPAVVGWGKAVGAFFQGLFNWLINLGKAIGQAFAPIVPVVTAVWNLITTIVRNSWNLIVAVIRAGINTARAIVSTVMAALRGDWSGVWNGIKNIVSAVWNGIRSVVSVGINNAKSLISAGVGVMKSLWSGAWNQMVSIASGGVGRVRSAVSGLRNAVQGVFGGAAGWLVSAGRNIINGLINGIQAGISRVKGLLNNLTSMLPSWKGPAEVDKRILMDSGRMVMAGFEQGLTSQFDSIRKTLGDLTGDLPTFAGTARGGDGASSASPGGSITVTIQAGAIVVQGQGREAGEEAAEAILERLAQATLVR